MQLLVGILVFILASLAVFSIPLKSDEEKRGVLLLDSTTFPKIVPNADHDVIVLVALKNQIGDYSTDSMRVDYFNFATEVQNGGDASHVLFSQVIVNGAENKLLAERIGVSENFKYPEMFIFPAGSSTGIEFPQDEPFNMNSLTTFAVKHSSLTFQLPGTMKVFDELAQKFLSAPDSTRRLVYLTTAEEEFENLSGPGEKETAAYYIKIMRKIYETGTKFVAQEIKRQTRILNDASKLTKASRRGLENRLNVLHHFQASLGTAEAQREEL
jgi:hypothetical protein